MKITEIKSHIISYPLEHELGYSQGYYLDRTSHLVEVVTDSGIVGYGECAGGGGMAYVAASVIERVISPMVIGFDPHQHEVIWHRVYNALRDQGRSGIAVTALSGVDIALWDIMGKVANRPLCDLVGGRFRDAVPAYGYGMMLQRRDDLAEQFGEEAARLAGEGFTNLKMKIGRGPKQDIALVEAVRRSVGAGVGVAVDANHCYTATEALQVGQALEALDALWFEEPVAPEDLEGYRLLRSRLGVPIAGGESEYTRWGMRRLLEGGCVSLLQPEVCNLGGVTEYLKVLSLAHAHFVPVINHCWGTAVTVALNLHLLVAMPPLPGGAHPVEPMLEYDTTTNRFRDHLLVAPLDVRGQIARNGKVSPPPGPGLGIEIDREFLARHKVN